jgi:hypothetical protein
MRRSPNITNLQYVLGGIAILVVIGLLLVRLFSFFSNLPTWQKHKRAHHFKGKQFSTTSITIRLTPRITTLTAITITTDELLSDGSCSNRSHGHGAENMGRHQTHRTRTYTTWVFNGSSCQALGRPSVRRLYHSTPARPNRPTN